MHLIFRDTDGRVSLVRGCDEYAISGRPGGYIRAQRAQQREPRQLMSKGWLGAALCWPHGKIVGFREALSATQRPISAPVYEDLSADDELKALAKLFRARVVKDRDAARDMIGPEFSDYWGH